MWLSYNNYKQAQKFRYTHNKEMNKTFLSKANSRYESRELYYDSTEFTKDHALWSATHEVHAIQNTLTYLPHSLMTNNKKISLYCIYSPCTECAKAIKSKGITHVIYCEKVNHNSIAFLGNCGITCKQWEGPTMD